MPIPPTYNSTGSRFTHLTEKLQGPRSVCTPYLPQNNPPDTEEHRFGPNRTFFEASIHALRSTAFFRCWNLLVFFAAWSVLITILNEKGHKLRIESTLLTVCVDLIVEKDSESLSVSLQHWDSPGLRNIVSDDVSV